MYVDSIDMDVDTRHSVMKYLDLISKRASGMFSTSGAVTYIYVYMSTEYGSLNLGTPPT